MEKSELANLAREARIARGWTERDAILAYGFRNVGNGYRRLRALENYGVAHYELLEKVIVALDLDREAVEAALRADRATEKCELADLVREARVARGWTERDAVRAYRFRSLKNGLRRLRALETTGEATPELLEKVIVALDLDREAVAAAIRADHADELRAWNEWADRPIKPYVVVRLVPGFYRTEALPADVTTVDAAEEHAAAVARHWRCRVCLVWSRRLSVWLDEKGGLESRSEAKPFSVNTPLLHLVGVGPVEFRAKA